MSLAGREEGFSICDLLKSSKNGSSVAKPKYMVPRQKASGATIGDKRRDMEAGNPPDGVGGKPGRGSGG